MQRRGNPAGEDVRDPQVCQDREHGAEDLFNPGAGRRRSEAKQRGEIPSDDQYTGVSQCLYVGMRPRMTAW